MNWHDYIYLLPAGAIACVILAVLIRLMPQLSQPSRRRTPAELALLCAIVALALFVVYGNFFLGKSYFAYTVGDPGSDAIEQYVPFYFNLIDNVRNGSFSLVNYWSFEYELGVNATSFQSWLYDPFNLIVVPLGLVLGQTRIALVLVIAQAIKVMLSAVIFDHLLTRYCDTPIARILGSSLFALCGYMLIYGQHYWLGSVFPLFALAVLVFELFLERASAPRFLAVTAVCAVLLSWTAYVAFMVLLFEVFYLLLRIPHVLTKHSFGAYMRVVLRMCIPVICGVLLSGVLLVPYALFLLTETSRTAASAPLSERMLEALTTFVNLDWIPAILSRFMGSSLITTGLVPLGDTLSATKDVSYAVNYTYEFVLLGYSCGVFLLLSQFFHWVYTERSRGAKTLVTIASVLVALYLVNYFLPTLMTAMVRLQYRSCFIVAVPVCIAMALGFEKRILVGKVAWAPLLIALAISLCVLAWSMLHALMGRSLSALSALAVIAIVLALVLAQKRPSWRPALLAGVLAVLVATSALDGFMGTNVRVHVDGFGFPLTGKSPCGTNTQAALAYLDQYDTSFYRVEKTYLDWTPLNDSLIEHYPSASAYNSTPDADVDDFYHKLWSEAISPWAVYSQGYWYDPDQPSIMALLDVKYILSLNPVDYAWCEFLDVVDGVYIYRNTQAHSIATLRQHAVGASEADALPDAAARRELLATSVIVPDEELSDLGAFTGASQEPAPYTASFSEDAIGHLTGTVSCDTPSIACLSIPHTGTWHVFVDGTEVETFCADYGFIGFTLGAGSHEIVATYEQFGLAPGLVCSLAGVVATVICTAVIAITHRARPVQPQSNV